MSSCAFSVALFMATIRADCSRGSQLEHGLKDARRHVARQQLAEHLARVGLEDELVARDALVGVGRRLDRQQTVDDRPLGQGRDEARIDQVDRPSSGRRCSRRSAGARAAMTCGEGRPVAKAVEAGGNGQRARGASLPWPLRPTVTTLRSLRRLR